MEYRISENRREGQRSPWESRECEKIILAGVSLCCMLDVESIAPELVALSKNLTSVITGLFL